MNCRVCGIETRRKDGLCGNDYLLTSPVRYQNTYGRFWFAIKKHGACKDCGEARPGCLLLVLDNGTEKGYLPPFNADTHLDSVSLSQRDYPTFCRCLNCQSRFYSSPGRPPKLSTEERTESRRETNVLYYESVKAKVLALFETKCVQCDRPSTRVLYRGAPGQGPKRGEWNKWLRRLLRDPEIRADFDSYCGFHAPTTITQRVRAAAEAKITHAD